MYIVAGCLICFIVGGLTGVHLQFRSIDRREKKLREYRAALMNVDPEDVRIYLGD